MDVITLKGTICMSRGWASDNYKNLTGLTQNVDLGDAQTGSGREAGASSSLAAGVELLPELRECCDNET